MENLEIVGRVLFSLIFLASGFGHFKATDAMAGYAQSKGVPAAKLSVQLSGLLMIVGASLTIYGNAYGALLLFAVMIPVTFLMHPFWKESDAMAKMTEQTNFLKDLALAGGALFIYAAITHMS